MKQAKRITLGRFILKLNDYILNTNSLKYKFKFTIMLSIITDFHDAFSIFFTITHILSYYRTCICKSYSIFYKSNTVSMSKRQSRRSTVKSNPIGTLKEINNMEKFNSYKVEQIEELKEIFKMYDRNNSGNITSRTLKFLLRGLGDNVSEEEVDIRLKEMDEDGNGTIDFHEFLLYMLEKVNKQNLCEDIIEIFKIFDRDDSGYLTKTEIKIITKGLLDEETV